MRMKMEGCVQLIIGPMFSGKSTELIRRIHRYRHAKLKCLVVKLPSDKEAQLGCLTKRLRVHFKGNSTIESKQQQEETFKQQLLAQMPEGATLTDEMFQMVLQMNSLVDTIPLVLNTPGVKHVGINMYVDDKGTAKGLATNVRASAIAQACGKRLEVKGDAFIGRVFDNGELKY